MFVKHPLILFASVLHIIWIWQLWSSIKWHEFRHKCESVFQSSTHISHINCFHFLIPLIASNVYFLQINIYHCKAYHNIAIILLTCSQNFLFCTSLDTHRTDKCFKTDLKIEHYFRSYTFHFAWWAVLDRISKVNMSFMHDLCESKINVLNNIQCRPHYKILSKSDHYIWRLCMWTGDLPIMQPSYKVCGKNA
jgi:hypothetical protein